MKTNTTKTILIDASLTGGRGAAKKAYEFVKRCQELGVLYRLLTSRDFVPKLKELGISPDYAVDVALGDVDERIQEKYFQLLKKIRFDSLVRFGARVPGPTACLKLRKPFVIVDGGLPDKLEPYPSIYYKQAYQKAEKYIVTTQFPWQFPRQTELQNIEVGYFTISRETLEYVRMLRRKKKRDLLKEMAARSVSIKEVRGQLFINLMLTDDYVANPTNRKTYGGWLTTAQYDQCAGFITRLVTDLALQSPKPVTLFVDQGVILLTSHLTRQYKNITLLSYPAFWDYTLEILVQAYADINISRAANYQPFVPLVGNGGSITTPVPAAGYMNEDTAAYQLQALGMTEVIEYGDEDYVKKLLLFQQDRQKQRQISEKQMGIADAMVEKKNSADMALRELGFLN